jgi:hypothetical protein
VLVWLLLGADLSQAGQALGRIAGFALLSLGLVCWPGREGANGTTAVPLGLLIYNLLTTLYLAYLGIGQELVGVLFESYMPSHGVRLSSEVSAVELFLRHEAWPALEVKATRNTYPTRPVRIIVGFPPGGPTDIVTRLIAQWLTQRLDQEFLVENRPGAASNIGTGVCLEGTRRWLHAAASHLQQRRQCHVL